MVLLRMQLMQRSISLAVALALGAIGVTVAGAQSRVATLQARPTNVTPVQNVFLSGGVSSGRDGERLTLQAKPCLTSSFRNLFNFRTGPGGRYLREYAPGINTLFRVRWVGRSAGVMVRQSPLLQLDETSAGSSRSASGVSARCGASGSRSRSARRPLGQGALGRPDRDVHQPGTERRLDGRRLQAPVPRGTQLRAVLTAAQASPCYLGSMSNPIRTQG